VLFQFLIEAVVIAAVGGLLGIALGAAGSALLSRLSGWPTTVPIWAVGLAAGFAAAVGVVFGWYPAAKAARLDPIEALRHE
jgi:ABC-type antimicrobial peptide transport system permease subunit